MDGAITTVMITTAVASVVGRPLLNKLMYFLKMEKDYEESEMMQTLDCMDTEALKERLLVMFDRVTELSEENARLKGEIVSLERMRDKAWEFQTNSGTKQMISEESGIEANSSDQRASALFESNDGRDGKEKKKSAVVMSLTGSSVEDIAEEMNWSINSTKSLLSGMKNYYKILSMSDGSKVVEFTGKFEDDYTYTISEPLSQGGVIQKTALAV